MNSLSLLGAGGSVPYFHGPVGTARYEDPRMVVVPGDSVDGHVVRVVGIEESTGIGLGTDVEFSFFRTDKVEVVLLVVKVERRTATWSHGRGQKVKSSCTPFGGRGRERRR